MRRLSLLGRLRNRLWRLVTTPYTPDPAEAGFLTRSQTQENDRAAVAVAVPSPGESRRFFGVDLARRGIQPVFLRITNRTAGSVRLQMVGIDPRYFTPLEAAGLLHFSVIRRLSAFGAMGWLFLPLLALVPLKLVTAWLNNGRMDEFFRDHGFRLRPIGPGETAEGFVFTTLDLGTKAVTVRLAALQGLRESLAAVPGSAAAGRLAAEFLFTVPVPGIAADYLDRDVVGSRGGAEESLDAEGLVSRLGALPAATSDATGSRAGDPVNLVVIGEFESLISGFAARWDESETITLRTCWKTVRAFLWGSSYRYSPVSPLHLFGREQDLA
ncbi:MAG: LssY C-terminal domain-containing protein, partial [Planctomycetia bacterium]